MSPEHAAVGEDATVADDGVVAEVAPSHDVIAAADDRVASRLETAVDGDVLAEDVVVADDDSPHVRRPRDVLRRATDDCMFADFVVRPGGYAGLDHGARGDHAMVAQFDIGLHRSEGSDRHAHAEPGLGTHGCQRMNAHSVPSRSGRQARIDRAQCPIPLAVR